jgi:chromosomal replication initiation ATPase DnaA
VTPAHSAILRATAKHFGVLVADLTARRCSTEFTRPRLAAYLLTRETGASFPALGRVFGRRHDSVLRGCRRARELCATDDAFRTAVESVRRECFGAATQHDADVMDAVEREVAP